MKSITKANASEILEFQNLQSSVNEQMNHQKENLSIAEKLVAEISALKESNILDWTTEGFIAIFPIINQGKQFIKDLIKKWSDISAVIKTENEQLKSMLGQCIDYDKEFKNLCSGDNFF